MKVLLRNTNRNNQGAIRYNELTIIGKIAYKALYVNGSVMIKLAIKENHSIFCLNLL